MGGVITPERGIVIAVLLVKAVGGIWEAGREGFTSDLSPRDHLTEPRAQATGRTTGLQAVVV